MNELAVREPGLLDLETAEKVQNAVLEEQVTTVGQLAELVGCSVAQARKILASEEIQSKVISTFKKSALAELDLLEIPELMKIVKDTRRNGQHARRNRLAASKRLRKILEEKEAKGPLVTINQNIVPAGAIENLLSKLPPR